MLLSTIEAPECAKDTRIVTLENRYALANKTGELSRLHKNTSTRLISHCIRREFHKLNAVSCNIQLAPTQAVTWNIRVTLTFFLVLVHVRYVLVKETEI